MLSVTETAAGALNKNNNDDDKYSENSTPCLKKNCAKLFFVRTASNFHQISIIFCRMMAKRPKLCEVHSFSTSSNLLNADVPNCYMVHI